MLRIAVLVSGGGTNLQALIDAQNSGVIKNGKIELVISSKANVFALERARTNGIYSIVVEKSETFEEELLQQLKSKNIDLIVLAGFLSILSKDFISHYKNRIINVHPSLIPSFCGQGMYGLKVHKAAIDYGVKISGATVHFVNEVPDGGKIIMQKAVLVDESDTPQILQERVMKEAEWVILPISVEKVCKEIIGETK